MPDIAAKESNGGHGFKTSLMAGLEKEFSKVHKLYLRFLLCALLQSCIQMDADADDHGEERIAFPGVDAHIMKMVIIEHPVIYPLAGSTVIVNCLIFLRPSLPREYRGGYPSPAWCRRSVHRGRKSISSCRGRKPFCRRQADSAICGNASAYSTPQLTMRKPAIHKGVPSSSMEREPGMESGRPRFGLRSIKGRISHFRQSP